MLSLFLSFEVSVKSILGPDPLLRRDLLDSWLSAEGARGRESIALGGEDISGDSVSMVAVAVGGYVRVGEEEWFGELEVVQKSSVVPEK